MNNSTPILKLEPYVISSLHEDRYELRQGGKTTAVYGTLEPSGVPYIKVKEGPNAGRIYRVSGALLKEVMRHLVEHPFEGD